MIEGGDKNVEVTSTPSHLPNGKFAPGNKLGGRHPGSRHKATLLAQQLIDGAGDRVVNKVVQMAEEGDATAMRLVVERLVPQRKSAPVKFDLPQIETIDDAKRAIAAIIAAQADGELTADEAAGFIASIETYIKIYSLADIETRLAKLEG